MGNESEDCMGQSSNIYKRGLELYEQACDLLTDPSRSAEIRTIIFQMREMAGRADADTAEDLRGLVDLLELDLEEAAEPPSELVRQARALAESLDATSLTREEFEARRHEVIEALNRLEPTTAAERRSIVALGQAVIMARYD